MEQHNQDGLDQLESLRIKLFYSGYVYYIAFYNSYHTIGGVAAVGSPAKDSYHTIGGVAAVGNPAKDSQVLPSTLSKIHCAAQHSFPT